MNAIFVPSDYFRELRKNELFDDPDKTLEIDIGCGDGSFLQQLAACHPDRNFLGIERLLGRIEKTARRIRKAGLTNARVLRLESGYSVGWLLPTKGVRRAHLLCPDPWPKKSHRKHRIINQPEFLDGIERVLEPGGEFLLKSDDADFFENALEVMAARTSFTCIDWPDDAFPYPQTAFEKQWIALGRVMHRARWRLAGGSAA
ncbi:MAG: tRNA (guanosine(46)-N7)-methyltransferase TrmB [Verrucomicrobiaceae bacterium]